MKAPRFGPKNGYGNIYTPHAGPMIIQVQRESGLASRTIILSQKYVRMLRFIVSKRGGLLGVAFVASWLFLAVQAARVPILTSRIATLERENQRIDTLAKALSTLHKRYDQVQRMLGVTAAPTAATTATSATTATEAKAPAAVPAPTPVKSPVATPPATAPATAPAAAPATTSAAQAAPAAASDSTR